MPKPIPMYFTLEELKHIRYMIELAEDGYAQGYFLTELILELLNARIDEEEELNA